MKPYMELMIQITEEHIAHGRIAHCGMCPIAMATHAYVGNWAICMPDGRWGILSVPLIRFVARFDCRVAVGPLVETIRLYPATSRTEAAAARAAAARAEAAAARAEAAAEAAARAEVAEEP